MAEYPCGAFNSVSVKPASFEGDKERFFGMYGNFANAEALKKGKLTNTVGEWYDPISSFSVDLKLKPGEEKTIAFALGFLKTEGHAKRLARKYKKIEACDKALENTKRFWKDLFSGLTVDTPDEAFNFLTNSWLKYQAISGRIWAKTAYYQSSGGYGFRDQLQDSQVFLPIKPELCRKQILMHAEHQFVDGTVHHWWHQLSTMGSITEMTDDLLWLVYVLLSYLEETKDFSILNIKRPYVDGPPGTIYEHCLKAIDKVLSRFSRRNLPLMGAGDWNDGFNLIGTGWKGESVWLAEFLYDILMRFAPIVECKKDKKRARTYVAKARKIKEAVNKHCWDGEWFLRAYDDFGQKVGSHKCAEGKVFIEPQGFCVLAGIELDGKAEKALAAVKEHLVTPHGILLQQPAYSRYYLHLGEISSYPPGYKENAGVFCHTNPWIMIAEAIVGHGSQAHDYYIRINPSAREAISDVHRCEPYVYAQMIAGRDAPTHGEAKNSWLTGTAAWNFVAITQWILGIRPTYDGLQIAPVIPADWPGFAATRVYRGVTYRITVERAGAGNTVSLTVDSKPIAGSIVPLPPAGQMEVIVKATLK